MSGPIGAVSALRAAGNSDPGLQRDVNEDRFHFDQARGLFMVVDGVGGQAAGGKAADTAISLLRARLERETGPVSERLREAITAANNEIHRLAGLRPEWNGMACVLTVAVVEDGCAAIGHVGDTRLYRLRQDRIEKVTRDHSPVGEREDAHEISELEAMHHPRRNEVYRDVGSEPHRPGDADFIDVQEMTFEPDDALLICSDGLTDLVDSTAIQQIVNQRAGQPQLVVEALIDAANAAGGKDNVTIVYVEGEQFAARATPSRSSDPEITRRLNTAGRHPPQATAVARPGQPRPARRQQVVRSILLALLTAVILLVVFQSVPNLPTVETPATPPVAGESGRVTVLPTQSIAQALQNARPGTTIVVAPGEYREMVSLKSHVRLVSQVRHGAVLRLPGSAPEAAAAIVATDVQEAAVEGFRVIGDAATPLGTGVLVRGSSVSLSQMEISGATRVAVDIGPLSQAAVTASDLHDNPGAALAVRAGAAATISHSVFMRNGAAGPASRPVLIETGSTPEFTANIFYGVSPDALAGTDAARTGLIRNNWFVDARTLRVARPPARGR